MTGGRRRWVAWCVAAGVATWLARPGAAAEGPSPAAQGAAAQAFKLRLDGKSKAAEHVKALEKLDPIQAARGKSLLLKTRAEKIALWEAVAAKHPDGAAAHAELGLHYLWDYKGDPAAQHVDKALKLDPSRTDVLLRVALAHSVAKRWAPAEAALRRYLAAAPAQPGPLRAYAQFCLAQVLRRSGRGADAEAAIRKAREIDPDCWTTLRPPPGELFTAP